MVSIVEGVAGNDIGIID